jgi:hypothetical protein
LILDGEIIKGLGPVAPPLIVHVPLVGQGPLPVLLCDGPVLGRLVLVGQAGDEVSHLSPEHLLCGRPPAVLHRCVAVLEHGPHELIGVKAAPYPVLSLRSFLPTFTAKSALQLECGL